MEKEILSGPCDERMPSDAVPGSMTALGEWAGIAFDRSEGQLRGMSTSSRRKG